MAKSSAGKPRGAAPPRPARRKTHAPRIAEMIDLVSDAKRIADEVGETFVAYLLAMSILEMQKINVARVKEAAAAPRVRAARPSRTKI